MVSTSVAYFPFFHSTLAPDLLEVVVDDFNVQSVTCPKDCEDPCALLATTLIAVQGTHEIDQVGDVVEEVLLIRV